jgi:predicted DNA-binding protein
MKQKPSKMVALRLPSELHEELVKQIGTKRGAFSAFVREAIVEKLGKQ